MRRTRAPAYRQRTRAALGPLGCALLAFSAGTPAAAQTATGLQPEATFSEYFARASSEEIIHRLLSPLTAAQIERALAQSGRTLREPPIDLTAQRFTLYVPREAPPQGYGLLVFIPPWDEGRLPHGWSMALEDLHTIFVSAVGSGNEADVLERRVPLALLAAENLMRRYPVDPRHVYVGGFSGGSRVALRLALAYPDLFRGALLDAGSDPLDAAPPWPPSAERLQQVQEASRIVYLTGEYDAVNLTHDVYSQVSMRRWCVFDFTTAAPPKLAHRLADDRTFAGALRALQVHTAPSPRSSPPAGRNSRRPWQRGSRKCRR